MNYLITEPFNVNKGLGGLSTSLGNQQDQPMERNPQVGAQMAALRQELEFHESLILQLSDRLTPVLSIEPPNEAKVSRELEPTCQLASHIQEQTNKLKLQSAALSSFLRRLEV